MKSNSSHRLTSLALTCIPLLGAIILITVSMSARAQDSTSSTTTTTTQPASVQPASSTVQTTTVTTVVPTVLYISKRHGNSLRDGKAIYDRPNGKVYNNDGDCIGHLTNLEGNDISAVPTRAEFKIRNSSGSIIASTRPSSAYDSDRKVILSLKDESTPVTSSTTTTHQTTDAQ